MSSNDDDYKVGYGNPPKHSQFVPGQSGNKGRKKATPSQRDIIRKLRDEPVEVAGKKMGMFELTMRSVINKTMKSGKPSDLKILFELLQKYGGETAKEEAEASKAAGDKVMDKLMNLFRKTVEEDDHIIPVVNRYVDQECRVIEECPTCGPKIAAIHEAQRADPVLPPKYHTPFCGEMEAYRKRRDEPPSEG